MRVTGFEKVVRLVFFIAHSPNLTLSSRRNTMEEHKAQGHPMDLFLKISVLQALFSWLGDVEEIIVLGRKVLLEKYNSWCPEVI